MSAKQHARHRATAPAARLSPRSDGSEGRPQHRATVLPPALTATLLAGAVLLALTVVVRGVIR